MERKRKLGVRRDSVSGKMRSVVYKYQWDMRKKMQRVYWMEKPEVLELERKLKEGVSPAPASYYECLPVVVPHIKCCRASRSLKY